MPWEGRPKNLHNLSKNWLKHLKVDGRTQILPTHPLSHSSEPA